MTDTEQVHLDVSEYRRLKMGLNQRLHMARSALSYGSASPVFSQIELTALIALTEEFLYVRMGYLTWPEENALRHRLMLMGVGTVSDKPTNLNDVPKAKTK